jgi:hypothetical protein
MELQSSQDGTAERSGWNCRAFRMELQSGQDGTAERVRMELQSGSILTDCCNWYTQDQSQLDRTLNNRL